MNIKAWIPLIVAIVLGLVAAFMAKQMTSQTAVTDGRISGTVDVVTANVNIAPGQEVKPEDLVLRPIAAMDAPDGTFLDVAELTGRVAQVQMVKGQPVLESLLAPSGAAAGLQALVPEGMRAITIEVNEFSGLAGMVVPGCYVDVLSTLQTSGNADAITRTIVQNVKVTAVGQRVSSVQEKKEGEEPQIARSITLLVKPDQAERLELAAATSRPRLALRSNDDKAELSSNGVAFVEMKGAARSAGSRLVGGEPADPFGTPVETTPASDPFATHPVSMTEAATQPTTTPYALQTREVQIIRGGVESRVTLEYRKPNSLITDVGTEVIPGTDSK